jgi:glycerol kinase
MLARVWRVREAMEKAGVSISQVKGIGVTNQRETTLIWDRGSGQPVYNAIVWQCRRTAPSCSKIKKAGFAQKIRRKTGLVIDAYFSATKIQWILNHRKTIRRAAERGELAFGTVDSWLAYNLTGKKLHVTDYSNASRTLLYNIHQRKWDAEILKYFSIPERILPAVKASSHIYGTTSPRAFPGLEIPLSGMIGDQQGALFGQACFRKGLSKSTYGTGCFLLMNAGEKPPASRLRMRPSQEGSLQPLVPKPLARCK